VKAMLLAAGEGTRLRPLTDDRPKAMVTIAGEPAVSHALRWLVSQGATDVAINLYHRPEVLTDFVGNGSRFGIRVRYSLERQVLGTAGALGPLRDFFAGEPEFLVLYGDVLTDLAIEPMRRQHRTTNADVTIALHHPDDPTSSGLIAFDAGGRITRFVEKPSAPDVFSQWANGGVYLCGPGVFDFITAQVPLDFGQDVFPGMLRVGRRLCAYASESTFIDFGTPERLRRAEAWARQNTVGM